jgi:hypothetical protein
LSEALDLIGGLLDAMGVQTHAIIENRLGTAELHTMAHQLNANSQLSTFMREYDTVLRSVCPTLVADLHAKPWELRLCRAPRDIDKLLVDSGCDAGYLVECEGPFGSLCVYENLAELSWYMCKWYAFLTEPECRQPLLEAKCLISTLLNAGIASVAVFVPDSAYDESLALDELHRTMPELLAWLREKCGPPADSFESIVRNDEDGSYSFKGYYLTRWSAREAGT